MSFKEKMDALDLIITALKEHEKRLDEIANKLVRAEEREKQKKNIRRW